MTDALRGEETGEAQQLSIRPGRVKSRIIEAHPPEMSEDGCAALVADIADLADMRSVRVSDKLWALETGADAFFIDALNERFWQLHTTAPAQQLERLLRTHMLRDTRLDSAWLPKSQLTAIEGERLWMKSSFASDRLLPTQTSRARRWRVQIEGDAPEELLDFLAEDQRYAPSAALSAIGTSVEERGIGHVRIVADYRGATMSDGDSFELVAGVLWRAVRRYERYVLALESRHQLRAEAFEDAGLRVDGDVAMIDFPLPVSNMDGLLDGLFSSREPFRLWAVPRETAPGQWEANAVDLHIGKPIRLELTANWLRVLLEPGTCGNTLARLVANLQHHFDARVAELATV
jgi:hypothetical protein